LYTPPQQAQAEVTVARLRDEGYEVCAVEVIAEVAKAIKAGESASLPAEVQDCLAGAEVCVILVDETVDFGALGGLASDGGCRVVTVGGSPDALPAALDDIIDGHVPSPDAPELVDVVEGETERVRPDHTAAPPRKPDRVKCQ